MNKRYQVFISSTYVDLKEERNEVMAALLELDCFPSGMELFPAADDIQWEVIKSIIDSCDYYILILGGRYGSVNKDGISYTELEYNYAIEKGIPTISFLYENINNLVVKKSEKTDKGKQKLVQFRNKVEKKLCKFWSSPKELGSVASRSLIQLIKTKPAIGWVKADNILTSDSASEILRLRKKIEELENKEDFEPSGTENLQQGNDTFNLNYTFSVKDAEKDDSGPFGFDILDRGQRYQAKAKNVTWNDTFYAVSPLMINESIEPELMTSINRLIQVKETSSIKDNFDNSVIYNFQIEPDDFHTIIIQLRALRLIIKNEKKRRVDDTNTYWSLSKYGDNLMMKMRALKK